MFSFLKENLYTRQKIIYIALALLSGLFLNSCSHYASEKDFDSITLNMPKQDVLKKMSSSGVARGSIKNKFGQIIEVREYQVEKSKTGGQIGAEATITALTLGFGAPILFMGSGIIDTYWLYFCDGELVQWGRAGDWSEAQKIIYEIHFKSFNEHKSKWF